MAMFKELEEAARQTLEAVGPTVVGVGRDGRGTGFAFGPGLVLTNAHNLRGATATVVTPNGSSQEAQVVAADVDGDLAVLRVTEADQAPPVAAWRADPVLACTPVFALAAGPGGARISFGLVSAAGRTFTGPRGRRIVGAIEHTAPLPRGASGGPVVDTQGRVVAISTHRLEHGGYVARPVDDALRATVDALAQGQVPSTPRLGVILAPIEVGRALRRSVGLADRDGLLVRGVTEAGAAAAAGIREGDLLVAAAGLPLTSSDVLHGAVVAAAGTALSVQLLRGAQELSVEVRPT